MCKRFNKNIKILIDENYKALEALDVLKEFKQTLTNEFGYQQWIDMYYYILEKYLLDAETLKTQNRNAYKEGYEQDRFDERMENEVKKNDL